MGKKLGVSRLVSALFLLGALLGSIPLGWLVLFSFSAYQPNSSSSEIIVVQKGQSLPFVAQVLTQKKVLSSPTPFIWLGRLTQRWMKIKAGEYRVSASQTPLTLLRTLASGISVAHPITVREGENLYEIATDLEAKGLSQRASFITLCHDPVFIQSLGFFQDSIPHSLEGYLFPDTYFFNRTLSPADMIKQMVRHFFATWGKPEEIRAQQLHLSRHQLIILASIIEKETGAPEERALISSVFHNRLRKGMRLQSDPTTIYGIWEKFNGKLHRSDLMAKNSYNTYVVSSLPIGPISNPGKEAIQAALFPQDTPFLFFVSHNDGTHEFTKSYEEHHRAVQKFQLDPSAREGKSWRDHLKKPTSAAAFQSPTP